MNPGLCSLVAAFGLIALGVAIDLILAEPA
jgi:hypothetical protein